MPRVIRDAMLLGAGIFGVILLLLLAEDWGWELQGIGLDVTPLTSPTGRFATNLVALLMVGVAAVAVLDADRRGRERELGTYAAALLATASLLPGIAGTATVIVYLTVWPDGLALLAGSVLALVVWLVVGLAWRRVATPEYANTRSFGELNERLTQIDARLAACNPGFALPPAAPAPSAAAHVALPPAPAPLPAGFGVPRSEYDVSRELAYREAYMQRASVTSVMSRPGLPWVMATGYVNVWTRIHRAEEALIGIEPPADVIRSALFDQSRLQGSQMSSRAALLANIAQAIQDLDTTAIRYFADEATKLVIASAGERGDTADGGTAAGSRSARTVPGTAPLAAPFASGGNGSAASLPVAQPVQDHAAGATPAAVQEVRSTVEVQRGHTLADDQATRRLETDAQARAVLRSVRQAINSYRDDRRDGLVRERNRLLATVLFTGAILYALIGLGAIAGVPQPAVIAAAAFFLVGAVVGLINRLHREARTELAIEDFGLSMARLIHTPLFSGVAAIAGVVLISLVPSVVAPGGLPGQDAESRLADIFALAKNPMGLVIAAVFGLTPSLLLNRLQQQGERYKSDLRATEPTATGNSAAGAP